MGISRQTFGRIVESARKTVARACFEGCTLRIEGGKVVVPEVRRFECEQCCHAWDVPFGTGRPAECPSCRGDRFFRVPPASAATPEGPVECPNRGQNGPKGCCSGKTATPKGSKRGTVEVAEEADHDRRARRLDPVRTRPDRSRTLNQYCASHDRAAPHATSGRSVPAGCVAGPRPGRPGRTALLALSGVAFVILGLSAAHGVRGLGRTLVVPVRPVDDPESMDRLGLACLARGDLEGAERWWLQSAEADPHRGAVGCGWESSPCTVASRARPFLR